MRIIAVAIVAATFIFPLTSCFKRKLQAPTELTINYDYVVSWSAIADARRYEIKIKNTSTQQEPVVTSNTPHYDLSGSAAGDYVVTVRAVSGVNNRSDSDWSAPLEFHRDAESGAIYKLINNDSAYEIVGASYSVKGDVVIEDVYRNKPVVSIGTEAFKNCDAETIVVGKNVTSIGDGAFYGSVKLKSVTLPEGLKTLGEKAFQSCRSLETVNIPKSIKKIGKLTFAYCTNLKNIEIHDEITEIGDSAFSLCKGLTSVNIPDAVKSIGTYAFNGDSSLVTVHIGSGVETIGEKAFADCTELKNVEFSESSSLKTLGDSSFYGTAIESFIVPDGVTSIGTSCFTVCKNLASVSIADTVTSIGARAFRGTKLYRDVINDDGEPIDEANPAVYVDNWLVDYASSESEELTSLDVTDFKSGTVGIADRVFRLFKALDFVNAPESLKYIGEHAFSDCSALRRVSFPGAVSVGDFAFLRDDRLTKADFTNSSFKSSLKTIGNYAFYSCTEIGTESPDLLVTSSVESVGTYAFKGTYFWTKADDQGVIYAGTWVIGVSDSGLSSTSISLKKGTVGIGNYAFFKAANLRSISAFETSQVKNIGRGAFSGCSELSAISFSSQITKIQPYTFYNCESLYSVKFSYYIEEIGDHAFFGCDKISELDLSNCTKLQTIGDYAFYGCNVIKSLKLNDGLKTIGNYAFANRNPYIAQDGNNFYQIDRSNKKLQEIIIPDSVTDIGASAFANYSAVTTVSLGTSVTNIGNYAFKNCIALTKIVVPDGLKTIGRSMFYKNSAVTEVEIGKDVTEIGDYAFYGMNNVEKLILPAGLKSIGKYAFLKWGSINSVILSKDIEEIGDNAFYGANKATFYTDASSIMPKWSAKWNSSYRPVVWNCTLSEDKSYVVSVKVTENGIENRVIEVNKDGTASEDVTEISAPERAGYAFKGWATTADAIEAEYDVRGVLTADAGTTLYAVWEKLPD